MYWTMCGKQGGVIGMCIGRVLDDVWTAVRVIGMCIGRVLDDVWTTGRGNRYVYCTMCGQHGGVIGMCIARWLGQQSPAIGPPQSPALEVKQCAA